MKQKLLFAIALLLPLIVGEVQAQKSLPSKHGFEQNRKSANARETFGQNGKSANARGVQSATTAKTPSRRSVLRAPSTDVLAPTDVAVSGITPTSATVSWNGTGDSYNLRYRNRYTKTMILSEDFESCAEGELPAGWTALDADGDGHSWITLDKSSDPLDDNGNPVSFDKKSVNSDSYNKETSAALTPDNWLISPQVPLKGKLSLWAKGVDPKWPAEHFAIYLSTTGKDVADFTTVLIPETVAKGVFTEYTADLRAYDGQVGYIAIRHFNVTDMYRLAVDNITITDNWVEVDGVTSPYTLDGLDDHSIYEVEVQAVTGEQQSSWSSTLSFYTLQNATILYHQNFDDTNDINELGWTFVDNDGDGRNWTMAINGKFYDRERSPSETSTSFPNSLYSQSFANNSAINADNWAITPAIKIYESTILSFQLAYSDLNYPDKVGVYVGETANVNEMTEVLAPTIFSRTGGLQFNEETVDLSAFAGKTCYIAFRHKDNDKFIVFIDDVIVYTTAPKYDLTLADGSDDHGTVAAFTVGGNAATEAKKYDVVTVSVTPDEGYSVKDVTVRAYTSWEAADARSFHAPGLVDDIAVTKQEDGTWTFTMPGANVWVTVTYAKNLQDAWIQAIDEQTYTGEAIEPTVTVMDGSAVLTLNTDYTVAYENNTVAGTATVTVTAVAGSNYSGTATATFAIQKADITMTTAPAAVSGLVYSGEAQTLITAGVASFGTVLYSLDGTTFSDALPQGTDVGTYTVTYKVEGDDNHNAFAAQTLNVTIATDKTALNNVITEAEAYYNIISESNPDAAATLLEAINTAKGVQGNADATQSEVETAAQTLYAKLMAAAAQETVILADGDTYTRTLDMTVASATYVKSIAEERVGLHQAWLVPFDYTLTSDDMNAFSFYKINMIANAPNPETETSDDIWVFLKRMNEGEVLHANMPYVYRAKSAVENYEFTTAGAMLKAKTTDARITMMTAEDTYTLYGTYEGTTATAEDPFYYVNINGDLSLGNDGTVTVGAYRWIMRVESKFTPAYARNVHFFDGEDSETMGISLTPNPSPRGEGSIYTLDGRRVAQPKKGGVYIVRSAEGRLQGKNGKKVVIK